MSRPRRPRARADALVGHARTKEAETRKEANALLGKTPASITTYRPRTTIAPRTLQPLGVPHRSGRGLLARHRRIPHRDRRSTIYGLFVSPDRVAASEGAKARVRYLRKRAKKPVRSEPAPCCSRLRAALSSRQWQRCAAGTSPRTCSTWRPHPAQLGLRHFEHITDLHIPRRVSGNRRNMRAEGNPLTTSPTGFRRRYARHHLIRSTPTDIAAP